jgi:hypothetical protein
MHSEMPLPLTAEEHRELGSEINAATARLQGLCHLVVNVYGPNNRAAFSFIKALEALDRLETDLRAQSEADEER